MRKVILAATLALAACHPATTTPATGAAPLPINYANVVGMIQTNYPTLKAALSLYTIANPAAGPGILAIEAKADPIVAALSSTSAPTSIQAALADMGAMLTVLPKGAISTQTQADISLGLALFNLGQPLLTGL